jgi:gluconolactonase
MSFNPDPAGTLMPDGTRWGAFNGATVFDEAGIFASPDADVEVIVSGIRWSEGPVWVSSERTLYFVDTIEARIYRWSAQDGVVEIVASEAGGYDGSNVEDFETLFEPGANGCALDGDFMIICQHPTRRVIRMELAALKQLQGKRICEAPFEVLADAAPNGRPLNAPNDVIVAPNGDIYFTDPVYGFLRKQPKEVGHAFLNAEKGEHPDQPYLDEAVQDKGAGLTGVFRYRANATPPLQLVTSELDRPNGLALSTNGQSLWVANSAKDTPSWHAFAMRDELPLERTTVLGETELGSAVQMGPGLSDGFKFDERGRIWSSCPGGLVVIDPEAKRVLSRVQFNTNVSNVRFGDGGDVFVTGLGHVWRLKRKV